MNELLKITTNEQHEPCISGRELHAFLESKEPYTQWFERMKEYGFTENVDFSVFQNFVNDDTAFGGVRKSTDHVIKLDMAKELAMIQRTEKGKQARQYFIAVEKEYNSPEKIMARALQIANKELTSLKLQNQVLTEDNEVMKPKALFADAVSASNSTILIGELAKILKGNGIDIGQQRLFSWLREKGYLIKRKGTDYNMPTQKSMDLGLFQIKENVINHPDGHIVVNKTPKVTGKGQQYFVSHFLNLAKGEIKYESDRVLQDDLRALQG